MSGSGAPTLKVFWLCSSTIGKMKDCGGAENRNNVLFVGHLLRCSLEKSRIATLAMARAQQRGLSSFVGSTSARARWCADPDLPPTPVPPPHASCCALFFQARTAPFVSC